MSIAIIYTTFLRDELAKKTTQSIWGNWNSDYKLLIGDQNGIEGPSSFLLNDQISPGIKYFYLPFDCGLSYARNYLVKKAKELDCGYCLVTADSIEFTNKYNFASIIDFMKKNNASKVGFGLNGRVPWEYDMELVPGKYFELTAPSTPLIEFNKVSYQKVDMCKNFFLATTESLLEVPWDSELKLSEHEDHCWRYKQAGHKTYFTDYISAKYIDDKPKEYLKYRSRMYHVYRKLLLQKYTLRNWIRRVPPSK